MMLNKKFKTITPYLAGVGQDIFFPSFILVLVVVALGCSSLQHADNETKVAIKDNRWLINGQPVHEGSPAEGLLMNVRMVNTVFEDRGPNINDHFADFDPDENTNRFIEKIPEYVAHGVRAFTISLQGGLPGYEGAINSAFNADGSLRKDYLDRVERIIQAADQEGVVIILTCFYQRQHSHDRALEGKEAIINAVGNVANWITDSGFSNVVLEISNEYAHGGFNNWKDGEWLKSVPGQVELIHHAKGMAPNLLVSTSGMGNGLIAEPIAQAADFIMIHFNNTALEDIPERIEQAHTYGKPVICNEDDKIGYSGAEAARLSVKHGAGWGLMHSEKNQDIPFEFDGADDDPVVYRMMQRLTTPGESVDNISSDQLSVLITAPKDGDIFTSGSDIAIRAAITGIEDRWGVEVHFFAEDQMIGKSTISPWEIAWENVPSGIHHLVAVVMDSTGKEILRSRPVDIEVKQEVSHMIFPEKIWKESNPESQGIKTQKLEDAVSYLQNNSGSDGVKELVIIRNGHLIWKGTDIDKVHNVWSLTKSFTSTVLGLLVEEGKASLELPAMRHVPEMAEDYPEVTLGHFTTMTSGYSAEGDDPWQKDASHGQSPTPFSPAKPVYAPAGSKFAYWDSAMNLLGHVLTQIAGKSMEQLFKERIAEPIGMDQDNWDWKDWEEIKGLVVNGGAGNKGKGIYISGSELARFGHLFLNFGRWNDQQLIPEEWVKEATSTQVPASMPIGHPSSTAGPGVYGYNWWVNGLHPEGEKKWPDAPKGTYSASGFNNNDMFVIPEWNMVIVRLGLDQNEFLITDAIYNTFLQKVGQSIMPGK